MLLVLLFVGMRAVLIDPICESCLAGVKYSVSGSTKLNASFSLQLDALSYSQLWLDFRHIRLNESEYKVILTIGATSYELTNTRMKATQYSLFVEADSTLRVAVDINDKLGINRHMFLNTVSVMSIPSDIKLSNVRREFLWVINQQDKINQPFNFPNNTDPTVFINPITDSDADQLISRNQQAVNINSLNDWKNQDNVATPYIPYFSNCRSTGGNIYPTEVLQNAQWCNIVPIDQIEPVNELMFGMTPYSDSCSVQLQCQYDEDPSMNNQYPYWQTLPTGINLMYVTKEKVDHIGYQLSQDNSNLVNCLINSSEGSNNSNRFPTTVELSLNYYQVSKTESHLIGCSVNYGLYTDATGNLSYTLTIRKKPLNHTYILIAFGFNNYVYVIAFIIIGIISNIENLLLALYHYVFNRKPRQPLKVKVYLHILKGMFQGSLSAILPLLLILALVNLLMLGELFEVPLYHYPSTIANGGQGPHVFWDLTTTAYYEDYSAAEPTSLRAGRQGFSLMVIAGVLIYNTSHFFIGWQRPKPETQPYELCGSAVHPQHYLQTKFLLGTIVYVTVQLALMYFAYTQLFSNNIWLFIVFTKVLQMVLEELTDVFFNDVMQCMPMKLITEITSYLNTLAANNFYDFMFSFLIDVGLTMIEKAYVASLQNIFSEWLKEKYDEAASYLAKLLNQEEGEKELVKDADTLEHVDEDKQVYIVCGAGQPVTFDHSQEEYVDLGKDSDVQDDSNETQLKRKLAERSQAKLQGENQRVIHQHELESVRKELQQRNNLTLQFTADLFGMPLSLVLQPFAILTLWLTYNQSLILQNYVIDYKYTPIYLLSAVMIGLFTIVNMVALFFLLENYHGLGIEQYIQLILNRFSHRKKYWKADEYDFSEPLEIKLRSVDSFCLSSQFYFLITLYVSAMFVLVVGLTTIAGQSYNPLGDPFSLLIAVFWAAITSGYIQLCKLLGRLIGIWDYRQYYNDSKVHCSQQNRKGSFADDPPHESSSVFLKPSSLAEDSQDQRNQEHKSSQHTELLNKQPTQSSIPTEEFPCFSLLTVEQSHLDLKVVGMRRRVEEIKETHIRLQSLCQKLESKFSDDKFRLEYALRNKDYLKANFDRIINSVEQLPEISEDILNYDNSAVLEQESTVQRFQASKQLQRALTYWLQETRKDRTCRRSHGLQTERAVKKCSFCFRGWGLYSGFGGMCLKCCELLLKNE